AGGPAPRNYGSRVRPWVLVLGRRGGSMANDSTNVSAHPTVILVRRQLAPDDLVTLNDEIAGLARAGLPLDQGLAALARDMGRGRLRQVTAEIAENLRAGRTLPDALA